MEESEIRVGFVTYAKELQFYNVKVIMQISVHLLAWSSVCYHCIVFCISMYNM